MPRSCSSAFLSGKKTALFLVLSFLLSLLQSYCSDALLFGKAETDDSQQGGANKVVEVDYKDGKFPTESPSSASPASSVENNVEEERESVDQPQNKEKGEILEAEEAMPVNVDVNENEKARETEETETNPTLPTAGRFKVVKKKQALLHSEDYYERRYLEWQEEYNFGISAIAEYNEEGDTIHRLLQERYEIFVQNDIYIEKHNELAQKKEFTYLLDHNEFSHLTYDEFLAYKLDYREDDVRMDADADKLTIEEGEEILSSKVDGIDAIKISENLLAPMNNPISEYYFEKYNGNLFHLNSPEKKQQQRQELKLENQGGKKKRALLRSFTTLQGKEANRNLLMNYAPPSKVYYGSDYKYEQKKSNAQESVVILYPTKTKDEMVSIYIDEGWQFYSSGIYDNNQKKKKGSKSTNPSIKVTLDIQEYGNNIYKVTVLRGNSSYTFYTANLLMVSEETTALSNDSNGSGSAVDCGGASITFSTLTFDPEDLEKEQLATMTATGTLTKPISTGSFTLTVKLAGSELYSTDGDACNADTEITLPAGAGTLNVYGFTCPAQPGPIKFGLDVILPSIAPTGEYTIDITGTDQDDASLLCIEATLDID